MKLDIDKIAISRQRNAGHNGGFGFLLAHVREEMAERAARIQGNAERILVLDDTAGEQDWGSVLRRETDLEATISIVDLWCGGSLAGLGDSGARFDAVFATLQLSGLDFTAALDTISSVLKPRGTLLLSQFGYDTLAEVRAAWAAVDQAPHVVEQLDMHHVGDALVNAGYQRSIVDTERLMIAFDSADQLLQDLRTQGWINCRADRRKTLTGRARYAAFLDTLNGAMDNGKLPITFEISYAFGIRAESAAGSISVAPPTVPR